MKIATTFLIAVLGLACFACASQTVDDAGITTKVKSKLAADTQTSAIKISVETVGGVVTLTGTVPTQGEKTAAEQIARTTQDVKRVDNQIVVDTNSMSASNAGEKVAEVVTDATILTKVKAKLLADGIVGTNVDVVNNKVTLKGQVEDASEVKKAGELARTTEGVTGVTNRLTAKKKK
ncbi:MAG: BON domain-containing protein [Acidobacteriota bacterium]